MGTEEYKNLFDQLKGNIDSVKAIETSDKALLSTIEKSEKDPEYEKRNELYTFLLSHYIDSYKKKSKHKSGYKIAFFIIIMLAFLCVIGGTVAAILIISGKETSTNSDLAAIIGGCATVFSALLVLPKVIAEHLFPPNDDANMIDMVKNMQLNDSGIRNMLHQPHQTNKNND